jgi:class 3 adenylate cyclase
MERKLTAILCADVYGYSRLMRENEEGTLHTLTSHRKLIDSAISLHQKRFVNFSDAVDRALQDTHGSGQFWWGILENSTGH